MADVRVIVSMDEYRVLKSARRMGDAIQRETRRAGAASRASGKKTWTSWNNGIAGVVKNIGTIAAAFGVAGTISAGIREIIDLYVKWKEHLVEIGNLSAAAGREMTALAMMQDPGRAGTAVTRALDVGVQHGFKPGEALSVVQSLQGQTGSLDKAMEAFRASGRLAQYANVPNESAGQAVSLMMGLGFQADVGARGLYSAGEASSLSPTQMAQMAPKGLPMWQKAAGGPMLGLATASVLSEVIKEPGRLGTMTERARSAVLSPMEVSRPDFKGKMIKQDLWESMGGSDLDFIGRLRMMKEKGITTEKDFMAMGITEKRELQAMSLLVDKVDLVAQRFADISAASAQAGLISQRRLAVEQDPDVGHQAVQQRVIEYGQAQVEREKKFPTTAAAKERQKEGEREARINVARHLALIRAGQGQFAPDEVGERVASKEWMKARLNSGKVYIGPNGQVVSEDAATSLQEDPYAGMMQVEGSFSVSDTDPVRRLKPGFKSKNRLQHEFDTAMGEMRDVAGAPGRESGQASMWAEGFSIMVTYLKKIAENTAGGKSLQPSPFSKKGKQ